MALLRWFLPLLFISVSAAVLRIKIGFSDPIPSFAVFQRLNDRLRAINPNATLESFSASPKVSAVCTGNNMTVECYRKYEMEIRSMGYDAIIGSCSFSLMEATNAPKIPYFVVSSADKCDSFIRWPNNVLWMNPGDEFKAKAVKTMFDLFRLRKIIAITDYVDEKVGYYHLLANYFYVVDTLTSNSSSTDHRNAILKAVAMTKSTNNIFLVLLKNSTMIKVLLKEALLTGYLNTGHRWFLPTFTGTINEFRDFVASDGVIYTFKVSNSLSQLAGGMTPTSTTEAAGQFIVDVFGKYHKTRKPSLKTLKASSTTTLMGITSFNTTTGHLLNDTVEISSIQQRRINPLLYIYSDGSIRVANKDHVDPKTWKVAVLQDSVYYNMTVTGSVTGFAIDLIKEFAKLNTEIFVSFVFPEEHNFTADANGLIDLLKTRKADIAIVAVPIAPELTTISFFNPSFGEEGLNMLMMRQSQTWFSRMVWYITVPFTINVWIGLAVCYLMLVFVLWATDKISPNHSGQSMFGVLDCFFLIAAAFMMAKLDVCPRMMSVRIFNLLLWFATLIMVASYAAALFPYILNKPAYQPVTSFQTAYDLNSFRWFFTEKSFNEFEALSNLSTTNIYRQFIKRARDNWPDTMILNETSFEAIHSFLVRNPNYISIGDSTTHKQLTHRYCDVQTVGSGLVMKTTSYPYRKDWSGLSLFAELHLKVTKTTLLTQLKDAYFNFNPCASVQSTSSTTIKPMGLFDVMGIFILLGGGVVIAFIIGFVELMLRHCNLSCQRCSKGTLTFGKTYLFKVEVITVDGVWVRIIGQDKRRLYYVTCNDLAPSAEQAVSPIDQGLKVGSKLRLRYKGNDPNTGERLFKIRS